MFLFLFVFNFVLLLNDIFICFAFVHVMVQSLLSCLLLRKMNNKISFVVFFYVSMEKEIEKFTWKDHF